MTNAPRQPLLHDVMKDDPIRQFLSWFQEAEQAQVPQPEAMTLATSNRQGKPAARIVLLRGVDERGFVFYTNYESRKGRELLENPAAALVFHWHPLSRQVRIEGVVEQLRAAESDQYFAGRPRGNQLEAHASPQSQVISDRVYLDRQFTEVEQRFHGVDVPRPPHWGGFRIVPEAVEFWQQGEHRLHDRLRYRRDNTGGWVIERLAP